MPTTKRKISVSLDEALESGSDALSAQVNEAVRLEIERRRRRNAHVVACVIEAGNGVIVTGDPDDMTRLAAPYLNVHVVGI